MRWWKRVQDWWAELEAAALSAQVNAELNAVLVTSAGRKKAWAA